MSEDKGVNLGTTMVWLGVVISAIGFLMLTCQILTCWWGKSGTCFFVPFILILLVGAVIAAIGYVFRQRHLRKTGERRP